MILVDTNVLLDLMTDDPVWAEWSIRQLDAASVKGSLAINDIVFAELSVRFDKIEDLEDVLTEAGVTLTPMPRAALFLAGKVFLRYRTSGGTRHGVRPDFFVGAHAAVSGLSLLTRDIQRYRTYFPSVSLIAPES